MVTCKMKGRIRELTLKFQSTVHSGVTVRTEEVELKDR